MKHDFGKLFRIWVVCDTFFGNYGTWLLAIYAVMRKGGKLFVLDTCIINSKLPY